MLVIGLIHGHASPEADNASSRAVAAHYRERFLESFGYTRCQDLIGLAGWDENCREMTGEAAMLLLDVLREAPEILARLSDEG